MIFDLESRNKNQKSESMVWIWLESNFESRIKNQKSESMRFFGSGLFIKIADIKIYRSLFFNIV